MNMTEQRSSMDVSKWKRRIDICPLIIVLAIVGITFIALSAKVIDLFVRETTTICLTPECIKTGKLPNLPFSVIHYHWHYHYHLITDN